MRILLLVSAGGALGAGARHLVNVAALRALGATFPWGTLIVNVAGAFAMGLVVEWITRRLGDSPEARAFLTTGILGGFTTFSAFALDAHLLAIRGAIGLSIIYVVASVVLSIGGLWLGLTTARAVLA
jgi:CrcB protein